MTRRTLTWLAVVVLLAAAAAAAFWWLAGRGRPQRSGSARLAGLWSPVEVRFDAWGVPHLRGERALDLAAALGWLHANDRMDQMELGRRVVAGRLAEVLGKRAVGADTDARTMRYREAAETLWSAARPETRRWLEAYAAGVNAWLDLHRRDLPTTLTLLRVRPEPWTPVDSLGFAVLMFRNLSFWQGRPEELRFEWLRELGFERTRELLGGGDLHLPAAIGELARAPGGGAAKAAGAAAAEAAPGSNNWVLGGSRTHDGRPIVANDPHLPLALPGVWYQVHLRSPDLEAAGMTLPGLPGVVIGRTGRLAWALTNVMLDDQDLFFERLGEDGRTVLRGDEWVPVAVRRETIRVRGGREVTIELRSTGRGPLLPADPELGLPARSLAWTGYLPADPLVAFLHLARSRRVEEVAAGLESYVGPAQNLVVADREGGLLYLALGRLPARRRGDGRLPAPGWIPDYGWDGLEPFDRNPRVLAPAEDLLVTANHDLRPPGHADGLGADFDLPARADRIRELLAGRDDWSVADLAAVQTDFVSPYAAELVRHAAGAWEGAAARAYRALAAWDGRMEAEGPAALFVLFEGRLAEAALGDELDLERSHGMSRRIWLTRLLRGEMSPAWFDDVGTPQIETRDEILERALASAWASGSKRWGDDPATWPYGGLHRLYLRHPLGVLPGLGRLFNRGPYRMPGSATTVAAFGGPWGKEDRRPITYGPSMRWITRAGDDETLAVLPGGQSGHPFDPHYDDQLPLYLEGRLRPAPWSEEAIEAATVSRIRLSP